eukprot:Amastigsp_a845690_13.p2 type:complete len:175 gc:universal Amastigsp_a845690_13:474-998(+)
MARVTFRGRNVEHHRGEHELRVERKSLAGDRSGDLAVNRHATQQHVLIEQIEILTDSHGVAQQTLALERNNRRVRPDWRRGLDTMHSERRSCARAGPCSGNRGQRHGGGQVGRTPRARDSRARRGRRDPRAGSGACNNRHSGARWDHHKPPGRRERHNRSSSTVGQRSHNRRRR